MKKLFCILISAFCLLPILLFAQKAKPHNTPHKKPDISLIENKMVYTGITFGPTVDWFMPTTKEFRLERNKTKGGFLAGVNVDVNLTPKRFLYFSTGLLCKFLQSEHSFEHRYPLPFDEQTTVRTHQTFYLMLPTGIKFRTTPHKNCIVSGQLGLYHNFRIGGKQFDTFIYSLEAINESNDKYFVTTDIMKNKDAALFAEAAYIGMGFEYEFAPKIRAFTNINYSCQFGYFSSKAINNVADAQFKSIVHSLHIVFGISF